VIIGRNEGHVLSAVIESLKGFVASLVYVDSASEDASVEIARAAGVPVIELEADLSLTIAGARNAGFEYLLAHTTDMAFVQFCDGDSIIEPGWLGRGLAYFERHPDTGAVCGLTRERLPHRSFYHRIRHMGWDRLERSLGMCSGNMLVRTEAFQTLSGFDAALRAGEDFDFCVRLAEHNWRVVKLGAEMAQHDSGALGFKQWWARAVRDGYGTAQVVFKNLGTSRSIWRRTLLSAFFWGGLVPLAILLSLVYGGLSGSLLTLLFLAAYPLLAYRIYMSSRRAGMAPQDAGLNAFDCMFGKFPQVLGQLKYLAGRLIRFRGPGPS
jgi:GT2 family glycosyltransferase